MKSIQSNQHVYALSADMKPVATAVPRETVIFETCDALGGQVQSEQDVLSELDFDRVNPATGPLAVDGAEPGDALVVRIRRIDTADHGVALTGPGMGVLGDEALRHTTRILPIEDGVVRFDELCLPSKPMIGVIGVAPSEGSHPTGTAHRHGGNMDTQEIAAGATLYLPAFQHGALLAIGDVHAAMGDGEVCITGCEVAASVVVEVDVLKGRAPTWPTLETDDAVYILVSLPTIGGPCRGDAARGALPRTRAPDKLRRRVHPFELGDERAGQPARRSQQDSEGRHPEAPVRRGGF